MVEGGEERFISAYSSCPVLLIKYKTGCRNPYALTFADAIRKFGGLLKEDNLGQAYQRAGTSFKGQLEQHFVILRETGNQGGHWQGPGQTKQQRKRPWEANIETTQERVNPRETKGRGKVWSGDRGRGGGA
jgi:hypothetical protein